MNDNPLTHECVSVYVCVHAILSSVFPPVQPGECEFLDQKTQTLNNCNECRDGAYVCVP